MCVTLHGTFDDDESFELDVTFRKKDDPDTVYHTQSFVLFGNLTVTYNYLSELS